MVPIYDPLMSPTNPQAYLVMGFYQDRDDAGKTHGPPFVIRRPRQPGDTRKVIEIAPSEPLLFTEREVAEDFAAAMTAGRLSRLDDGK